MSDSLTSIVIEGGAHSFDLRYVYVLCTWDYIAKIVAPESLMCFPSTYYICLWVDILLLNQGT